MSVLHLINLFSLSLSPSLPQKFSGWITLNIRIENNLAYWAIRQQQLFCYSLCSAWDITGCLLFISHYYTARKKRLNVCFSFGTQMRNLSLSWKRISSSLPETAYVTFYYVYEEQGFGRGCALTQAILNLRCSNLRQTPFCMLRLMYICSTLNRTFNHF